MIVSKTRIANGWLTQRGDLIPNGVKCNENVIWVSVLRLGHVICQRCFMTGDIIAVKFVENNVEKM